MKQYLVTFTPMEPYFFGNEKNFKYPGQKNSGQQSNQYFIKSELVPSQTTLLGALRYILLPVKKSDYSYTDDEKELNNNTVGKESFDFSSNEKQCFGKIKEISPLFLVRDDDIFVATPFDHINGKKSYTPFSEYKSTMTPDGEYFYNEQFSAKEGVTASFMRLEDGKIFEYTDLFTAESRVGINCSSNENGFFKKEYVRLSKDFSFAVHASFDDDILIEDATVFLGQGKSVFKVNFMEQENKVRQMLQKHLRNDVVYCFGDSFVHSDVYKNSMFAITKTKDYRAYTTQDGRVKKGSVLYKTLCAGSIFIPKDINMFINCFQNQNAQQIGYNNLVSNMEVR